jgi:outer membrane protein W
MQALTFLFGMVFFDLICLKTHVMKKVMIITAILGIGIISKAQTFSIGPTGGYGHSWISNSGGDNKFNPFWNGGLSFIYSTRSNFGIGADVKYSAEGNKLMTGDGAVTNVMNLNYVRVPVNLIYFFGNQGNAVRPKISVGPSFGFLTNANETSTTSGVKVKTDLGNDVKNFDFGLQAEAGLNFRLAPRTWLNTDLAYYHGLTDITKNNGSTQRNRDVGVNVGLLVGMGK